MRRGRVLALMALAMSLAAMPRSVDAHHEAGSVEGAECPEIIVETFGENAHAACQISWCESRWNPSAWNGQDAGDFQINRVHGEHSTFDRARNVAFAYQLSRGGTRFSSDWVHCALRYGLP